MGLVGCVRDLVVEGSSVALSEVVAWWFDDSEGEDGCDGGDYEASVQDRIAINPVIFIQNE